MALSTVAEWAGSAVISKLVETAYSYLGELPVDTEFELRRVKAILPKIEAIMGVAEVLKFKHPNSGVNAWLDQFKEAFLAAEDVLDELKYWKLGEMVKNQEQVSGFFSSIVGSLKRKFSGPTTSKDTLKRLSGAVQMLDLAAANVGHFFKFATALDIHCHANNNPIYNSCRETTSILTENNMVGRETEKATIIEWSKKMESHVHISAFCIVGAGGLGKTTLAQLVFEEINTENHFDKIIWVCVSTSFSVEDITRKILQEFEEKGDGNESLNRLHINLKEKVLSKKILFILDDVWNDEKMGDWKKLIAPLKFVQQGSKILLTTRMKSVADMLARVLNVEPQNLVLDGLEEQELLELFNKYAFYGYQLDNHKDLQKIGNDIVKKLRGSPLAAKVIGSLLNSYMDFNYWKRILDHDSLINLEQAKNVADVLKLSYYHLPAHLQECFRFCSIFPQDNEFEKDELIKMWMASGFIRQELHGKERPEDIGEEYLIQLLRKSFLEQRCQYGKGLNYYAMHDLMHDLAQNVSKGECCRVEPNGKSDIIPCSAQHVSIHESEIKRIFNLKNLRTLVITLCEDHINGDRIVPPNCSLKKTLRLLVIQGKGRREALLKEIGSLLHLRFLKVKLLKHGPFRYLLPNSICKLYHLQVLDINNGYFTLDYEGVETTGMSNLVSLRYMKLPNEVMQTIHGVHKLTSLQELNFFVERESGYHIYELEMLNNLRYLSIEKIENVGGVEATSAKLSKKESLISLSLNWTEGSNSDDPEQVIDNLRPNQNLKILIIKYYMGLRFPIWMRCSSHLNHLVLRNCPYVEALPFLGHIPHLKILALYDNGNLKEVEYSSDNTTDCAFPSLERLYCANMPQWESLGGPHSCYSFPNLKNLVIENCPNLTKLPAIPCTLFRFQVRNVGLDSLPDMHHGSSITTLTPSCMKSLLRVVEIIDCPKLIALNGFLQQQNLDLQVVEELTIRNCDNLVQLPTGAFGKFVSLKYLKMGNCGELDVPLLESASHLSTLARLFIWNSANITCIPSSANAFTSLRHLTIRGCDKLIEMSSMQQAHTVNPGNNLVSLKISEMQIDHLSLLLIEPFRCLRFVSILRVEKCSGMEALPEQWLLQNSSTLKDLVFYDASSLCSLPGTIVMLTALERLRIYKATLLEETPEFPTSLIHKNITREAF